MKSLTLLFLCLTTFFTYSQIPDFDWVKVTKLGSFQAGRDMVIDSDGNSYTTGYFRGNTDFDPGSGTYMLNGGPGGTDVFVLKLAANGSFVWARSFNGSITDDFAKAITIDSVGDIYVTGEFEGTVDFDPGVGVFNLTSEGAEDVFIVKLSSSGNLLWAKSFGGVSAELVFDIKMNNPNTLMLTGFYHDTVDFDPGLSVYNLFSAGYQDAYLLKLNTNGDFQWAKSYGGSAGTDQLCSVDFDSDNNIYIGGYFKGTVDLDLGPDTLNYTTVSSWQDLFVQKMDSSGNEIWTSVFHGQGSENIATIKHDPLGNVYFSGSTNAPVDFDPGPGVVTEPNIPTYSFDGFLVKLSDSLGDLVWVKMVTGQASQSSRDFDIDTLGNIFLTGSLDGTADLDPGPGVYNLTAKGVGIFPYVCDDAFITKLTPAGELIWVYNYGGIDQDEVFSLHLGDSGYIYAAGLYSKSVDFDPGAAVYNQSTLPTPMAAYVYRINECFPGESTANHIACGSFTWINGVTYTSSNNTAKYVLADAAANGCDSIIHLNLIIRPNSYRTETVSACSSFTWINGITYTSSTNNPTYTLPNSIGCDSIITLHLTIYPAYTTPLNVSACGSYLWPTNGTTYTTNGTYSHLLTSSHGCDSLVVLNLTIGSPNSGSENRTECDHYMWPANGVNYTNSGIYNAVTQNSAGCDSAVTLNLTIIHSTSSSESIEACDTYTWSNGVTYTSTGTYSHTFTNSVGCDSITHLNLIIHPSNTFTENITACDDYYWPVNGTNYTVPGTYVEQFQTQFGCDSIYTLHLTVNQSSSLTSSIESCGSYTWTNGTVYSSSGTFTQTLTNESGCDSTVTLNLTVYPTPQVSFNGSVLTVNTPGNSYQWLNCVDFAVIPGETSSSMIVAANGSYAVVVTTDHCMDTSACTVVTNLKTSENSLENTILVRPNPTTGKIVVNLNHLFKEVYAELIDLNGKTIQQDFFLQVDSFEWTLKQVPGAYILKVDADGNQSFIKIILN